MKRDPFFAIRQLKQSLPGLKAIVVSKEDVGRIQADSTWQSAIEYTDNDVKKQVSSFRSVEIRTE